MPLLLVGSCAGAVAVSWHVSTSDIPSLAFRSHVVLAVQVALLFFYAALLLLVPLMRALFDGDLPVELSLRGARWREKLYGVGGNLLARQAEAEGEVLRIDTDVKEEVRRLRYELKEAEVAQERVTDGALRRISVLEEQIGSRGSRR